MNKLLIIIGLCFSAFSFAEETYQVDSATWSHLENQYDAQIIKVLLTQNAKEIEQTLLDLPQPRQSFLRLKLLKSFPYYQAMNQPWFEWAIKQVSSNIILTVSDQAGSKSDLVMADVALDALSLWKATLEAPKWVRRWKRHKWNWQEFYQLENKSKLIIPGFLKGLDEEQLSSFVDEYLVNGLAGDDNGSFLLLELWKINHDQRVFRAILEREVDADTKDWIAQLATGEDPVLAIDHLRQMVRHRGFEQPALTALAKYHLQRADVQSFFITIGTDERLATLTAEALSQSPHIDIASQVIRSLNQLENNGAWSQAAKDVGLSYEESL